MSDLVPAGAAGALPAPQGRPFMDQVRGFANQPAVKRTLPFAGVVAAVGGAALLWAVLSPAPQRILYSELADSDRAGVTAALDQAGIAYQIDSGTGAISVGEDEIYRARMVVASDGAIAAPSSGTDLIDSMPMGASRNVEAQRLRAARERELEMTIRAIDGVESVRVHLAEAERSIFVRENAPPRASVMLKLKGGRSLDDAQVRAIVNLVAGSVPGISVGDIKVVDQHGRLLSDPSNGGGQNERLDLQARIEDKLRAQLGQLLTPMFGDGNFSTEVQVELDMDAVTSARESYEPQGTVRTEMTSQSQSSGSDGAGYGVPGALSNSPPPPTEVEQGPPQGTTPPPAGANQQTNGDTSASRTFDVGRQVSVTNSSPGGLRRLTVAVVVRSDAGISTKPADLAQIKGLISAAVGANLQRGDQVEVIARKFTPDVEEVIPFYDQPWFLPALRYGGAVLGVLLFLLFVLRPVMGSLKRRRIEAEEDRARAREAAENSRLIMGNTATHDMQAAAAANPDMFAALPLTEQVGLAQRYIRERPDTAVAALRQLLADPDSTGGPSETRAEAA